MVLFKKINSILEKIPAREKRITWATMFTLARIIITPFFVGSIIGGYWFCATILFLCAALTDIIDGFIARHYDQKTVLGACLDPLADKVFMLASFSALAFTRTPLFVIPVWFFVVIFVKELLLVLGALWLLNKGNYRVVPSIWGKIATFLQICVVIFILAGHFFCWIPVQLYYILLSLTVMCTGISLVYYAYNGINIFIRQRQDETHE